MSDEVTWKTPCISLLRSNKTSTVTIHCSVDQRSLSTNLKWSLCRNHRSHRNTDSAKIYSCCHCDSFLAAEILSGRFFIWCYLHPDVYEASPASW